MTRLDHATYLRHLRTESQRFRDVVESADPRTRVPACPDWDADDLLWHLGEVQHFWGWIVSNRPAGPGDYAKPERPEGRVELLRFFEESSRVLATALAGADPTDDAWTWSSEQTVGFTFRRQAHEALIHRLDAEQAVGDVTALDPVLAADGVAETLEVMYGGCPPWGTFTPLPRHLRFDLTDTGDSVWVQLGRFTGTDPDSGSDCDEDDIAVVADPGVEADAVVGGTAAATDTWLWKRGDDEELSVTGDRSTYDRVRQVLSQPLN
ncbi:MAG: maleylpyruvate isomerase family mycothiol-dependent enzyme [Nocardioides sp.]